MLLNHERGMPSSDFYRMHLIEDHDRYSSLMRLYTAHNSQPLSARSWQIIGPKVHLAQVGISIPSTLREIIYFRRASPHGNGGNFDMDASTKSQFYQPPLLLLSMFRHSFWPNRCDIWRKQSGDLVSLHVSSPARIIDITIYRLRSSSFSS